MKKKMILAAVAMMAVLLFSGCGMRTVEEMYSPPRRTSIYNNLQAAIDTAMSGHSYSAPLSGDNRQTVQVADLDGDGVDEFIIFTKTSSEKPLQILILRECEDGTFREMDSISCNGTAFEQIEYVDMDGHPGCEIVVGRRLNDQVMRIASVYSFSTGQPVQLMSTIYSFFQTYDFDLDGRNELMVIRRGETETGNAVAALFGFQDDTMERSREAELSGKAEMVKRVTAGKLQGGQPAVYIASSAGDDMIVTDILTLKDSVFTNISFSGEYGTSVQTLRNYYVYSEDIDNDGVLELPSLMTTKSVVPSKGNREQYVIRWYSLDPEGREVDKQYTFHNYAGGWYIQLDSAWANRVAVDQNGYTYTFYVWSEDYSNAMAVFSIFTLMGKDKDSQASTQNRFALYRGEEVVYAAKLETASALNGITEEYLESSFHLIYGDRKPGET